MTNPIDRRCTNEERNNVNKILSDALSQGQLNVGEFDERTKQVYVAQKRSQLVPLISDLVDRPESHIFNTSTGPGMPAFNPQANTPTGYQNQPLNAYGNVNSATPATTHKTPVIKWIVGVGLVAIGIIGGIPTGSEGDVTNLLLGLTFCVPGAWLLYLEAKRRKLPAGHKLEKTHWWIIAIITFVLFMSVGALESGRSNTSETNTDTHQNQSRSQE